MSYFKELDKFLKQSDTADLKTSQYLREYEGLKVKVSFGQGQTARVSWVSFLAEGQTTSEGIYPVYLYYKDQRILILAYGVSETNPSKITWKPIIAQPISEYFKEIGLGKPPRYGASMIYKLYSLSENLDAVQLEKDLRDLIDTYKKLMADKKHDHKQEGTGNPKQTKSGQELFDYKIFQTQTINSNLNLDQYFPLRFIASLLAKQFVILTGLSGSGKTKLAQAFSKWICDDDSQFCLISVGADWTNREPLLGYPNALEQNTYVKPDNGTLDLIISANQFPDKPYFLILDEMNLSHVERYFADFLSAMESGESILLHAESSGSSNKIPSRIKLPRNLFIIGTVNIDETTYMFSPKVLDRANVIEFRVTLDDMKNFLNNGRSLDLSILSAGGAAMAQNFLLLANDNSLKINEREAIVSALINFFRELKLAGAEFGYRSASEILRFAAIVNKIEPLWNTSQIVDAAIMQKLLPRVHGSRRKLEPILKALGKLCLNQPDSIEDYLNSKKDTLTNEEAKYPLALEKIIKMYKSLMDNGFTSYAEA